MKKSVPDYLIEILIAALILYDLIQICVSLDFSVLSKTQTVVFLLRTAVLFSDLQRFSSLEVFMFNQPLLEESTIVRVFRPGKPL